MKDAEIKRAARKAWGQKLSQERATEFYLKWKQDQHRLMREVAEAIKDPDRE